MQINTENASNSITHLHMHTISLIFKVLHLALQVSQFSLQLHFIVAKTIKLPAQVSNVGLKHCFNVGAGGGLLLK